MIGFLLTGLKEKRQKRQTLLEQTADAHARSHAADLDAEGRFISQLLGRVAELERREEVRTQETIARMERMMKLESDNVSLNAKVEALKYELAGKINAAVSVVEQKAAVVLSEAIKREEGRS